MDTLFSRGEKTRLNILTWQYVAAKGSRCGVLQAGKHSEVLKSLKSVLPYLIVKKEKAEQAIKYIEENWGECH